MRRPDTITISMREPDRCKVIEAVVRDGLMVWRAAEKLGISRRQVERLAQRYRQDGPQCLVSRRWGQPGHNQLPPGVEAQARGLIRDSYTDFGPTLVAEKLRERHGIDLAKETVRRHHDRCRLLGAMQAAAAQGPPAAQPPGVPGRTGPTSMPGLISTGLTATMHCKTSWA